MAPSACIADDIETVTLDDLQPDSRFVARSTDRTPDTAACVVEPDGEEIAASRDFEIAGIAGRRQPPGAAENARGNASWI